MFKFVSFWHGRPLSKIEILSMSSFLYYGHEFHLYTYDKYKDLPDGVILHDANEILDRSEIFEFENSYAMFADIFRYKLLRKNNDFCWVDLDCICLSEDFLDFFSLGCFFGEHQGGILANGVMYAKKYPKLLLFLEKRSSLIKKEKMTWSSTSTALLSEAVKKFGLEKYVLEENVFYEIKYEELHKPFYKEYTNEIFERLKNKKIIHLWNSGFTREGFNPGTFEQGSFLDLAWKKYFGGYNE